MRNITRSWPQGLVLFLQPARMNPFGRAEKDHAEKERRDHEQKRTKMPPLRLML
jgi:hypothetical protein